MDRDVWMLIIGIIAGGVVSWLITIKYANRHTAVRPYFRTTSLEPTRPVPGFVQTFGGSPIEKPHHFEFSLVNMGPQDIAPDDFAGGSCTFELSGAEFLAVIENPAERPFSVEAPHPGGGFTLQLEPCLIPKGGRAHIALICSGRPEPSARHIQLRNIRLDKPNAERWSDRRVAITSAIVAIVLGTPGALLYGGSSLGSTVTTGLLAAGMIYVVSTFLLGLLFGRREPTRQHGTLWD